MSVLNRIPEFYEEARKNEAVFRAVLQDIKRQFPAISKEINPNADLEKILEGFSSAAKEKKPGVINFQIGSYKDTLTPHFPKLPSEQVMVMIQSDKVGYVIKYSLKNNEIDYLCSSMVRINHHEPP